MAIMYDPAALLELIERQQLCGDAQRRNELCDSCLYNGKNPARWPGAAAMDTVGVFHHEVGSHAAHLPRLRSTVQYFWLLQLPKIGHICHHLMLPGEWDTEQIIELVELVKFIT